MPNKELRFLIADGQHFYRLKIERALNQLGYYRIAPMQNLKELLSVIDAGSEPVDLLIVNASITESEKFDLLSFVAENSQVRYTLIYGDEHLTAERSSRSSLRTVQLTSMPLPDMSTLNQVMAVVDPRRDLLRYNVEAEIDRAVPTRHQTAKHRRVH
ncbi:response regulator [Pseudomonas protegens]|uniref:response regulator n=1 Tax=Pseudomonas protegens TaxID=380021 RepID=UPI002282373C|nr:response regulator [Pseudomonas protegens]MCY7261882.1 response regulator [Pseudomonas protegens]